MAVNETIVTGRKFRKLVDEANKLWQRISFWTKASDVEFNDGSNAETKLGNIAGVTDSLTSTSSNVAASAKAVKELNDKITELNSDIRKSFTLSYSISVAEVQPNTGSYQSTVSLYLNGNYIGAIYVHAWFDNGKTGSFTVNI